MCDPNGIWSQLHHKAFQGDLEGTIAEIENSANVNATNYLGQTSLHTALANCSDEEALPIVIALIDHNADLDLQDVEGFTALYIAASEGSTECVQALLDAGANPLLADHQGCKPSHHALTRSDVETPLFKTLKAAERRQELQQIAAISRPADVDTSPPQRRSSGFMM